MQRMIDDKEDKEETLRSKENGFGFYIEFKQGSQRISSRILKNSQQLGGSKDALSVLN